MINKTKHTHLLFSFIGDHINNIIQMDVVFHLKCDIIINKYPQLCFNQLKIRTDLPKVPFFTTRMRKRPTTNIRLLNPAFLRFGVASTQLRWHMLSPKMPPIGASCSSMYSAGCINETTHTLSAAKQQSTY